MANINNPKYLVSVGVFSAIYIVVFFATAAMGLFGPPFLFIGWIIGTIMNGAVLALYRARVPVVGAMALLGFFEGLIAVGRGYPWYTLVGATFLGLIADLIAQRGQFKLPQFNALGYGLFAIWIALPLLPVVINQQEYFAHLYEKAHNQEYVAQMEAFLSPIAVGGWMVVLFIVGLIGGVVGHRIVQKHFVKAGLVS